VGLFFIGGEFPRFLATFCNRVALIYGDDPFKNSIEEKYRIRRGEFALFVDELYLLQVLLELIKFVSSNKFLSHVHDSNVTLRNINVQVLEEMVKTFLSAPGLYPFSFYYCAWHKK